MANMTGLSKAHSNTLIGSLNAGLQNFVSEASKLSATTTAGTPATGLFYSTVVGRAQIPDIANDMRVSFGVDRIATQSVYEIQNEFGTSGEKIFGVVGDDRGLVRLVGSGWANNTNTYGSYPYSITIGDYIEIVFYGTGLNISFIANNIYSWLVSTDGGSDVATSFPTYSAILGARNYASNQIVPIVSGLSLGMHTVRIKNNSAAGLDSYGFEILTEKTALQINPGTSYINGLKATVSTAQSIAYNSTFASGTLGTRGGRVLVYQNSDGTISKAVTPVNTAQANLTAADHTNEEISRRYHFREFGAGRSDDFSLASSSTSNYAFTLDDGSTTLVGSSVSIDITSNGVQPAISGGFLTFTFIGSGIDLFIDQGSNLNIDSHSFLIDGVSVGSSSAVSVLKGSLKIVSGLPYGTHTLKILRNAAVVAGLHVLAFIVYQPKTPTLPANTVQLGTYNVMADYVAKTTSALNVSIGTLSKTQTRELTYIGTWSGGVNLQPAVPSGFGVLSTTSGDSFSHTFFGTGCEIYLGVVSGCTHSIQVDGVNYAGTPNIITGSGSWSSPTLTLTSDSTVQIIGLTLGLHTVKFTKGNTNQTNIYGIYTITPIHAPKVNANAIQNTAAIGSCAISDDRKISIIKSSEVSKKNIAQAFGIASGPTTTSTAVIPMPDMSVTIITSGGALSISYNAILSINAAGVNPVVQVYVNGAAVGVLKTIHGPNANYYMEFSDSFILPVSSGVHKVDLYWSTSSTYTTTANGNYRNLTVKEV